jgi:branched-chain amino acid transport system permease protein
MFVDGLSLGSIYALLAMGFVIIFKATQVLNFAHGSLAALGAFLVAALATTLDFPGRYLETLPQWAQWSSSVAFALVAAAIVGMVIERVFLRPMLGEPLFAIAIVTLGVDIVLRNVLGDFIGVQSRPLGDPWGIELLSVGPLTVPHTTIAQILVALVLMVGVAAFFRTSTGTAMRATAFDQEVARAQGINVGRIFSLAWAIGAILAAVAGIFISVFPRRSGGVDLTTAFISFRAFPAIILGGLDSVVGAVVGGFIVGFAESIATVYFDFGILGTGFGGVAPYLIMMLVLLVKPYGLFGTAEVRRV